ncbi:dTMP kinase [Candidatus Pacearchaeota archaeon CG10_big_fil_rev_8_21_14_0_10_31_9]|nr:MAG: dTMP kinase [Candidatus Pacearchaeota archaeon CG10_big_fil_rev_8_21_14_0_10_31_9]PIZ82505.1 MAG: dTMP kinase [Candidatus Pacearchaeota archaeon CG_4_10_14_0_2_um_filter_05_32_18]
MPLLSGYNNKFYIASKQSFFMAKVICLEGITGAGKTTQARKVEEYLTEKNYGYLIINEKHYSPFKEVVLNWHNNGANQTFSKKDVLRFAKARAETHKEHFYPLLDEKDYLIFDRSLYTSGVYQSNDELSCAEIVEINLEEGAIKPERGAIFLCSPKLAIERIGKRRLQQSKYTIPSINETLEEISKRRELYIQLLKSHLEFHLIDSGRTEEEIFEELKIRLNL